MIVWGRPTSVNVQKVLWALDELSLEYELRVVGGVHGGLGTPEFAALTPMRKVPVLQDGDLTLWESHAILRHLARKERWLNDNTPRTDMWMEFGTSTLQPPFLTLFWQRVRLTRFERNPEVEDAALQQLRQAIRVLEEGMAGLYVAGDTFGAADIALGALFYRILHVMPEACIGAPRVLGWLARLSQRPAYRRHIETSFDELRAAS